MSDEEASLAGTVRTIAGLWEDPRDSGIWPTVNRYDPALYEALMLLVGQVREFPGVEPAREYPAEKRVADLEGCLDAQHRRQEALHQARKSWGGTMSEDVDRHALNVTRLAQAFEKYLTDGTVHPATEDRAPLEASPNPVEGRRFSHSHVQTAAVLDAALVWVDRAHLHNPSGSENWRNWANEHDIALINAVLAYRGLPPLERKAE